MFYMLLTVHLELYLYSNQHSALNVHFILQFCLACFRLSCSLSPSGYSYNVAYSSYLLNCQLSISQDWMERHSVPFWPIDSCIVLVIIQVPSATVYTLRHTYIKHYNFFIYHVKKALNEMKTITPWKRFMLHLSVAMMSHLWEVTKMWNILGCLTSHVQRLRN
jgi:hypothetical protein